MPHEIVCIRVTIGTAYATGRFPLFVLVAQNHLHASPLPPHVVLADSLPLPIWEKPQRQTSKPFTQAGRRTPFLTTCPSKRYRRAGVVSVLNPIRLRDAASWHGLCTHSRIQERRMER